MFSKDDLKALITTVLIIALGYASMYILIYFAEYLNVLVE
jgi:hypothetical protein